MKPRTLLVRVDEGEPVMLDEVDGKRVHPPRELHVGMSCRITEQGDIWLSEEPCLMCIKYDAEGRPTDFEKQLDVAYG